MKKNVIKLNERKLNIIIKESIKKVLNEEWYLEDWFIKALENSGKTPEEIEFIKKQVSGDSGYEDDMSVYTE